jgi:hypothetical protein
VRLSGGANRRLRRLKPLGFVNTRDVIGNSCNYFIKEGAFSLDNTHVKVYFSILGDVFPIDVVTERLFLKPTESYYKGNVIRNEPFLLTRKETNWAYGTEYQESYDIMEQVNQVLVVLEERKEILIELSKEFEINYLFMIVICVRDGKGPAIYLDKRIVKFAGTINAEIHFDVYDFA